VRALRGPAPRTPQDYERSLAEITIGRPERLSGPIQLCEHDAAWPAAYRKEAARIRRALGARARRLEHVGSTSVPGLAAKPIIDIVLEVSDPSDEPAYVPDLQDAGYVLRIREAEWFEHRMLRGTSPAVNLHVFGAGCPETQRMVRFRDWLRGHPPDRARYDSAKRELAAQGWTYMQQYADAKTSVIAAILERAGAASGESGHQPIG
jgi:GrpB-like predicted nucleotidyltransferase (UPF0157 family)